MVGTRSPDAPTRDLPLVHRGLIEDLRRLLLAHPNSGGHDALSWLGRHAQSHVLDYS